MDQPCQQQILQYETSPESGETGFVIPSARDGAAFPENPGKLLALEVVRQW
jgi:hypothetical protein